VIKKYKTNDRTIRLLHEHINTQPVTDLSQFEIKPHAPIAPRARSFIQLLDISIEGEQISVKFELKTLPREVNRLELIIPFPRKITFTRIPRHQG